MMGFLSDAWDPLDLVEEKKRKKKEAAEASAETLAQAEGYDPQKKETKESLMGGYLEAPVAPWEKEKAEQSTGEYWAKNLLGINSLFSPLAKKTHAAEMVAFNEAQREGRAKEQERLAYHGFNSELVENLQDGNDENNLLGVLNWQTNTGQDLSLDDLASMSDDPMFHQRAFDNLPDIMQTSKMVMDAHNADPANANDPWDIKDAFSYVKKYDLDLVGGISRAQAEGAGTVNADLESFATAQGTYINAFDQAQMYNDGLARVDQAIELFDPNRPEGALDTGIVNGFIYNTFGIGEKGMAALDVLSKDATIDKLMSFKGPTTDFEFTKAEAAAFAQIMKGGEVNKEILETVRGAISRAAQRNSTSAEAAFGTMRDFVGENGSLQNMKSTFDIYEKNYKPWWKQSSTPAEGPELVDGVPTFRQFEKDAKERGITDAATIRKTYNSMYGG